MQTGRTGFSPVAFGGLRRPQFGSATNREAADRFVSKWLDNFEKVELENVQTQNMRTEVLVRFEDELYRASGFGPPMGTMPERFELTRLSTGESVLSYTGAGCFGVVSARYLDGERIEDFEFTRSVRSLFEKLGTLSRSL